MGRRRGAPFRKGKLLLDLSVSAFQSPEISINDVFRVIDDARRRRNQVGPVLLPGIEVPMIGDS
jgi:hypothetical protein